MEQGTDSKELTDEEFERLFPYDPGVIGDGYRWVPPWIRRSLPQEIDYPEMRIKPGEWSIWRALFGKFMIFSKDND